MKKKIISRVIAIVLCIILVFISVFSASANYVTDALIGNEVTGANWMSSISDETKLSDISMPGTHDSGTKWIGTSIAGAWTTTQDLTIPQQLEAGVRYLDIRLAYDDNYSGGAKVVHSSIECLNENNVVMTFTDVCRYLKDFLSAHPTETVVVSVKQDSGDAASTLASRIESTILSSEYSQYWYTGYSTPTLGNVRGKAVIAPRMGELYYGIKMNWSDQGSDGSAVNYTWYQVQDRYNMGTSNKWLNAVKPMLDEEKSKGVWYINFLSTTGGGASGVSANASAMNGYFNTYEMRNNKCYGVVIFDYITDNLAKKVYKCNDLTAKNQPDSSKGQYYYRINLNTTQEVSSGWSSVWMKLYYKENNGTGTEKSVLLFENGDEYNGYQFVCNKGNFDFSGVVDGFPTKVEFHYDWGYGAATLKQDLNLYVSATPTDTMYKCTTNSFENSSYVGTPCKGTESYNTYSYLYPSASTVKFDSSVAALSVPAVDSDEIYKSTQSASVYDQYGVKWYEAPTKYSISTAYDGVTLNGNTLSITNKANHNPKFSQFTITAEYSNSSVYKLATKTLSLYTNEVSYSIKSFENGIATRKCNIKGCNEIHGSVCFADYYNTQVAENDGAILDINGDNIINAKDYAQIIKTK